MKKSNLRRQLCTALLVLGISATMTAQEVRTFNFNHKGKTGIELKEQTRGNVTLEYNIDEMSLTSFSYKGEEMQAISINDIALPNAKGLPNVPCYSRTIAIPQGAEAVMRVISFEQQVIKDVNIEPSLGIQDENSKPDMNYTKDMVVYNENAYYPAEFATISAPSAIRGVDVVNVSISPVRFNPVTKEAIVYHNVEVEIEFVGGNGHFGDDRLRSPYFDPILAQNILNYNSLPVIDYEARMQEWLRDGANGAEYIIITPNSDGWAEPAQRLKEYRMQQGIITEVYRLDEMPANNTTQMKSWFHNAYNTWDIAPVAILLFADHNTNMGTGIPAIVVSHPYSGSCITDNQYSDVDNNHLPDMVLSRLVAANATEAAMMADKQIEYEYTNPNMDEASYNAPVSALGWQTERWFQLCSEVVGGYFRAHGKNPTRINCIYDGTPGSIWSSADNTSQVVSYFGPDGTNYIPQAPNQLGGFNGGTPEQIVTAINNGTMLVQHRDHGLETGWGEPAFRNSHVDQLTNVGKMPFVMSINCLTGKFDNSSPCFAEAFMRRTYMGQNAGAVGLLCPTEVSYSFVNDAYVWGVYDQFDPDFMPTLPANTSAIPTTVYDKRGNWRPAFGNVAGKYFLYETSWPYNPESKEITYIMFTAHCDAFLRLYTEVPQAMVVEHAETQPVGLNIFPITAPEGATIALTKGEGADIEIVAVAQATGDLQNIEMIPEEAPTVLHLTVTGQNYLRYEDDINVIPVDGPYLIVSNYELGDGEAHLIYDTDNGFNIQLKNVGNSESLEGTVTLTSESEYVTITNDSADFDAISSDNTFDITEAFAFSVSNEVPNMTNIGFTMALSSGDDIHERHINIKAYAPELSIGQISMVELEGNGNGRPDPGETMRFSFPINNDGNADSKVAHATLVMNNPYIQILTEPTVNFETITTDTPAIASYDVYIGNAPTSYLAEFSLSAASGVYTSTRDFATRIGLNVEDFELGVLNTSMWNNDATHPWTFVSDNTYEGQYCLKSGQISDNQETSLTLTYTVLQADSIAFYYKVSSENNYDKMYFYIDNQQRDEWSGDVPWNRAQYAVTQGTHTFRWKYKKDYSVSNGSDCCWIDFVILPRNINLSVSAGVDVHICADESAQLNGTASNQTSLEWTTAGDGTFNDATILDAVYTPGPQDIANGGTTLTLTAYKDADSLSDDMVISFINEPVATAVDQITAMTLDPISISISIQNLGIFSGWTTTGAGTFANSHALQTVYTPSSSDYDNVDIVLTANYTGCGYKTYQHNINVHFAQEGLTDVSEAKLNIHPNPTNDVINISIADISSDIDIVIYNSVGQMVYHKSDTAENGYNAVISLGELSNGTYILQVRSDESIWTNKIVKR